MSENRVFSRPPPLAPSGGYEFTGGKWYKLEGSKYVPAYGVHYQESIYYLWFEFPKRSERYKTACANSGAGMKQIFADFGNIHEYEFWDWWLERGAELFAEKETAELSDFIDLDEALSQREAIEAGDIKLLAIPTNLNKTEIRSKLDKLLKNLEVEPSKNSTALYPITKSKIDGESLAKCLLAYDLKQENKSNLFIGGYVQFVSDNHADESLLRELETDARKFHIYIDNKEQREKYVEEDVEVEEKIEEAIKKIDRRLEREGRVRNTKDEWREVDDDYRQQLIDKELGLLVRKTGFEIEHPKSKKIMKRAEWKRYLNTSASRMIKKADANIAAVEQGKFPIGHG